VDAEPLSDIPADLLSRAGPHLSEATGSLNLNLKLRGLAAPQTVEKVIPTPRSGS
jgi:hypothetical protein